jgi:hypothetical protein
MPRRNTVQERVANQRVANQRLQFQKNRLNLSRGLSLLTECVNIPHFARRRFRQSLG